MNVFRRKAGKRPRRSKKKRKNHRSIKKPGKDYHVYHSDGFVFRFECGSGRKVRNFEVIPSYTISGETSFQPFDDAQRCSAFYDWLRAGETCTPQVSPGDFVEAFKPHAEKGEAVLGLIFSSALSGTYASACMARDIVHEDYPDAVIELVDTLAASAGEGMVVYDAVARRDAGMAIDENAAYTRAHLQEYAHWFTVDDLHFLKRGGRCSPSAVFFGTMLKIKPVLHGQRGAADRQKQGAVAGTQALRAIAMKSGELEADGRSDDFHCYAMISEKDAMVVKETLVKEFGCDPERIILSAVGPGHRQPPGPGTVALFFRGKDRG